MILDLLILFAKIAFFVFVFTNKKMTPEIYKNVTICAVVFFIIAVFQVSFFSMVIWAILTYIYHSKYKELKSDNNDYYQQ